MAGTLNLSACNGANERYKPSHDNDATVVEMVLVERQNHTF